MAQQGLFKIDGCPDRTQAVSGMAHFSGGGPSGAVCGQCRHYGTKNFENKCVKYRELGGKWGANIKPSTHACKYFSAKEQANARA